MFRVAIARSKTFDSLRFRRRCRDGRNDEDGDEDVIRILDDIVIFVEAGHEINI